MNAKVARIIGAAIFLVATTIAAFVFVKDKTIGEWTFAFVLAFSLAAFALLSSIGDLLVLRFWNLELKFREIEKREESVKKLASAVLELAESNEGNLKLEDWDSDKYERAKTELKKLIR